MQKFLNKAILSATMSTVLLFQPFAAYAAGSQHSTISPQLISKLLQSKPSAAELQSNTGPLISPRLNTTSADKVKVIVQMKGATISEGNYATRMGVNSFHAEATVSAIQSQHTSFIASAMNSGIPIQVTYQYDTVLNGMEVELPANQIPKLAKLPGVKSIYENRTYYSIPDAKVTPSAISPDCKCDIDPLNQIGVPAAWGKGLTGKGIKIGVIDTGVDYVHPDLKDAYKGGHDSFFNTDDPYEEIPNKVTKNEGTQHGTHVSGTIAGRGVNPSSDIVQKGVAYESELHVYKVLGFNAETGRSSGSTAQVIDGIEHAVKDHMDVINLSLGSDDAKDNFSPDAIAINNAVLAGVTAVVASGNAADSAESYYYSMGSPASSQLAITVGAVDSASTEYTATVTGAVYQDDGTAIGTVYQDQGLNVMGWRTGEEDFPSILGTEKQEAVYVGLGADKDYASKDVTGKIAFISRGLLAFVDKIAIAKEHGAKAVVIFNGNATTTDPKTAEAILSESIDGRDSWINTPSLGDSLGFLPTFDMEGKTGRAIAKLAQSNPGSTIKLAFGTDYPSESFTGDHMATFSSRGPNTDGKLGIKPDLAAPGVNIMSTWPAYGKNDPTISYAEAYERISGTSMATPHVAGLALLLKQEHPEWTPFEIRAALANTADEISDEDGIQYDVYSQGAGRVNIAKAINTPAVLETVESLKMLDINMNPHDVTNYGDNASFGIMKAGDPAKSITLQVNNTSAEEVTYTAEVVLHDEVTSDPYHPIGTPEVSKISASLTGLTDGTVTAAASEKKTFALEVAPAADAVDGVYEGDVVLKAEGKPTLHIPFVVHVGTEVPDTGFTVQDIQLSSRIVSPDGDGLNDTIDVSFKLAADDINLYLIEIDDMNDQAVGFLQAEGPYGKPLKPGRYSYKGFDGTYSLDADLNENPGTLKDGTYSLAVVAYNYDLSKDAVVRGAVAIETFSVQHKTISTPPTSTPPIVTPPPAPTPTYALTAITGQGLQSVTAKSTTTADVATVTDEDLKSAIGSGTAPLAIVVNVDAKEGKASKLSLTAAQLALLAAAPQGSTLYLNTGASAVELPLSLLKSVPAGSGIELVISSAADQAGKFEAEGKGTSIVGVPVSFEVNVVNGTSVKPLAVPANVFVKRSFTLDKGFQTDKSGVLFIENGKVAPAPAVFTSNADGTTTVVVNRPGFSVYAAVKHEAAYSDISTSWAQSRIQALAEKFLINGTTSTTFSPKKSVTRAEFAAMLTRGLGLSAAAPLPFTDVESSAWYYNSIGSAYAAGLITGYADDTFRPDGIISRQELAVMLTKASKLLSLKADNGGSRNAYNDESSFGSFAKDSIEFVTSAGLMEGTEIGGSKLFNPSAPTTREAAATVLYKLLQAGKLI
ncbi:S8 family serine peptidase [Paenibacillus sp. R14(2021)]|uniref:S8 family serine peptidase n=1 Tax=Paenibacillus sp. R14(2021) TaxID=2859228 RepID=UPI001C611C28|nr:S8 family serine peptidase [Paenibacillus sp. R14(2021)]